jgi:hypothetical protein
MSEANRREFAAGSVASMLLAALGLSPEAAAGSAAAVPAANRHFALDLAELRERVGPDAPGEFYRFNLCGSLEFFGFAPADHAALVLEELDSQHLPPFPALVLRGGGGPG